ncbi:protein-L-isoaspartate O-methyltransferase [compost metagenome]
MDLEQLKRELERFGKQHDEAQPSRGGKMLNITRDTGELLALLVQTRGAQAVLEIGTSNGYSTLWLAEAVKRLDGRVTTIERDEKKISLAEANFQRCGTEPLDHPAGGGGGQPVPQPADGGLSAHLPGLRSPALSGMVARNTAPACPSRPAGGGQCHLP